MCAMQVVKVIRNSNGTSETLKVDAGVVLSQSVRDGTRNSSFLVVPDLFSLLNSPRNRFYHSSDPPPSLQSVNLFLIRKL